MEFTKFWEHLIWGLRTTLLLKSVLSPGLPFLINHTSDSKWYICFSFTAWKVSKYGPFSGPYFPVFRLNKKIYSVIRRFIIWTLFTPCFYSFVCQYTLHYYWCCYNQKQSSGAVPQKRCSFKFRKIQKKTPKKRFPQRCFLVSSAKFSITSF